MSSPPSPPGHTVKSFDDDLRSLRSMIGRMGGLARKQLDDSIEALLTSDEEAADRICAKDKELDEMEMEAEAYAISIIARRAPMAGDLREVIAALKIGSVIERVGDYAKNCARRVSVLAGHVDRGVHPGIAEMARMASSLLDDALTSFAQRDSELAKKVAAGDEAIDDYYESLFQALLAQIAEDPNQTATATHFIFIIKNLERVGDHATNIAEMVHYSATGDHIADRPKGGDATEISLPL
ncbi:phosphate transport system regulatory protein PhoU [Pacificimonas flava]|uniref:Phosphate-specific transport system accessory protein PhoU n=2 Tax=Pacificimonas TaxID=1960290 RepID=A0A219B6I7_9SPHN|nr:MULTISPECIES: phosphate signaling complex protein PhoU [Pacificimonas]MBZ6378771.1 phosphate signaling complex protein PhoU [Pacificimonas aurantium]OWV33967.1 phosphate transport system regulatory protein PhoU [Pacificimonas flava]